MRTLACVVSEEAERGLIRGAQRVDRVALRMVGRLDCVERVSQRNDRGVECAAGVAKRAERIVMPIENRVDFW